MDILTINVVTKEKDRFIQNNQKILDAAESIEGLKISVGDNSEKYEQYCMLLNCTDSKYVVFYNDDNTISLEKINESLQLLKAKEDNILCQKVDRDNPAIETDRYLTGGMSINPLYFGRYIFRPEVLRSICIEAEEIPYFEDRIILEATKDVESIQIIPSMVVYTKEALEKEHAIFQKQFHKSWYIPYFRYFVLPYVKKDNLTTTEQRLVVYMIMKKFYLNQNARNKFVLDENEIDEFYGLVREILQYIDDEYLVEIRKRGGIANFFAYLILKEKYQKEPVFRACQEGKKTLYYFKDIEYGTNCVAARIKSIDEEQGNLLIDGEVIADYCFEDVKNDFTVLVNGEKIEWKKSEIYNLNAFFGRTAQRYTTFMIVIPKDKVNHNAKIQFQGKINDEIFQIPLEFHMKTSARITRSHWAYWRFADKIITFAPEYLRVKKVRKFDCIKREAAMILKIMREKDKSGENQKAVGLRLLYWMTRKSYQKKPIWLYYDKLYKAGDNGEYLFKYNMKNYPEADNYYIISKDSLDYLRLKKEFGNHIVVLGTIRQKLLTLNAQIIFATHSSVWAFCGFPKETQIYYKNLLNARIVCIQHGLTIQNIAQYQNRLVDNTKLYFCASKYEIENLERPIYGYDKDELKLTGCPRYDGLKNNDKKQILIAPTWRRNIVITGNEFGTAKEYNPEFKNTEYFRIYNQLINDKRLLSVAKKYGYKIVFLIHPTLSSQVDDYEKNDYTSIIPAVSEVSYEKMLTESSVMVTDYSGIQFDFAYMKKPILYYQPKELPPQYTEGVYKYDTMGFGPILEEYDDLIHQLCGYVENGCVMDEDYLQRVDDFFEYTDYQNCKRIMDIIQNWEK